MQITFPDIRKTLIPDDGFTIIDIDEEGADARVVAWEADDADLKAAFASGVKIHAKNALDIYGPELAGEDGKREPTYTRVKRGVHGTHYGMTPPSLAAACKMTLAQAEHFQTRWLHELHPSISEWMSRVEFELQSTGGQRNKFGYEINFFERGADAYTQALAWVPSSTVARVCEIAMTKLHAQVPEFQLLLQVHDSLVAQVRTEQLSSVLPRVKAILDSIVVPYADPLIIPWGIKASTRSWGECEKCSWGT